MLADRTKQGKTCLDVGHSAGCLAKQGKMCLDVGHSAGCLAKVLDFSDRQHNNYLLLCYQPD